MENNKKIISLESDDIESRIIILKRRAAEADFLREERDMLISRLKLYNPDYIWPDSGINKCLKMPTDEELNKMQRKNEEMTSENNELKVKNEELTTVNKNLKISIKALEQQLVDLKNANIDFKNMNEENKNLKENLQLLASFKENNEQLLIEKQNLKKDLEKMLEISGSEDPIDSYKRLLKQLYVRIDELTKQKQDLQNATYSRDIQIEVLNGKISHLNAKLNEPYINAKIKLSQGQNLSDEEAYIWAVDNLEMTNKKLSCDLQKITEQFNLMAEKYLNIQQNLKPSKLQKGSMNVNVTAKQLQEALISLEEGSYKKYGLVNLFKSDLDIPGCRSNKNTDERKKERVAGF